AEARSIFWVVRGIPKSQILRGDLDGGGRDVVHEPERVLSNIALDVVGKTIYYTASSVPGGAGIWRVGYAGGQEENVVSGDVYDIAVDGAGGSIYFVREGAPGTYGTDIWRADLDGANPHAIIHHPFEHHTTGIALDTLHGKIYWATVDYRDTHAQIVQ